LVVRENYNFLSSSLLQYHHFSVQRRACGAPFRRLDHFTFILSRHMLVVIVPSNLDPNYKHNATMWITGWSNTNGW
jgi:hypothetical protein